MYRNALNILYLVFALLIFSISPVQAAAPVTAGEEGSPAPAPQSGDIDEIEVLEDGTTLRTVIPAGVPRASRPVGGGTNMLVQPSWLGAKIPGGLTFLNGVAIQVSYGVDKHALPDPAYFEITFSQPEVESGWKILHWENQGWKEIAKNTLKAKTQLLGDYVLATDALPTSAGAGKSFILKDGTQVIVSIPQEALPAGNQKVETVASLVKKDKLPGKLPEGQNLVFVNAVYIASAADGVAMDLLPGQSLIALTFAKTGNLSNLRILHWRGDGWKEVAYDKLQVVAKRPGTYVLVYQK